jgi:hypothetical protein
MNARAQWEQYHFERPLNGIDQQWHRIELPNDIFRHLRLNYADLRILGINAEGDTIEAPYILQLPEDRRAIEKTAFRLLNPGTKGQDYFVTMEQLSPKITNRIQLNFANKNFDWHLRLEGSQDLKEWLTILEDYRILDIENEVNDYTFSTVQFPESQYRYYRVTIPGAPGGVELQSATSSHRVTQEEKYRNYRIAARQQQDNKTEKRTELEIKLPWPVPVSLVRIEVEADYDYYRPVTIQALTDSTLTETDTSYVYEAVHSDVLSSLEEPNFYFPSVRTYALKIYIDHEDNAPLTIKSVQIQGRPPALVARFNDPAEYVLRYGLPEARPPRYDLANFTDKIPEDLSPVSLGEEVQLRLPDPAPEPLMTSKWWLWGILIVAVVVLGWFAMGMLKS